MPVSGLTKELNALKEKERLLTGRSQKKSMAFKLIGLFAIVLLSFSFVNCAHSPQQRGDIVSDLEKDGCVHAELVYYYANDYGVNPGFLLAKILAENQCKHLDDRGNVRCNAVGACGIGQITESAIKDLNRLDIYPGNGEWSIENVRQKAPEENIRAAAAFSYLIENNYLSDEFFKREGVSSPDETQRQELEAAIYNFGSANVQKRIKQYNINNVLKNLNRVPDETRDYVQRVMSYAFLLNEGSNWPTESRDVAKTVDTGLWINPKQAGIAGDNVYAIADGVVVVAETSKTNGNWVKIRHGMPELGLYSLYLHGNDKPIVKAGDVVKGGDKILTMGSSGKPTDVALYFEILVQFWPNQEWQQGKKVIGAFQKDNLRPALIFGTKSYDSFENMPEPGINVLMYEIGKAVRTGSLREAKDGRWYPHDLFEFTPKTEMTNSEVLDMFKKYIPDVYEQPDSLVDGEGVTIPGGSKLTDSGKSVYVWVRKLSDISDGGLGLEPYLVQGGDSLDAISKRYSVSVQQIKEINSLSSINLLAGQKLKIPMKAR